MANQEHLNILKQGVKAWNAWRELHQEIQPDLSNADLHDVILSGADLRSTTLNDANLRGAILNDAILNDADLSRAILRSAYLSFANLRGANLSRASLRLASLVDANLIDANLNFADLSGANLSGAKLSNADLHDSDLRRAILNNAILNDADLSRARVSQTVFATINLRNTKGLVEIQHDGPSSVTLNTIQLPHDGSALHFLRGAGVPDEWIDFWRSTMIDPIQYRSLFISYSSQDEMLARRLYADLQNEGVRCWFAPEDLKIGDHYHQRIDESIHLQDKLLLLLSEHAIASAWVEREVVTAREKEDREHREVLFPICVDDAVMYTTKAWAADVRRRWHIGDFTQWKNHDAYQIAFERLLRDLKVGTQQ